MVSKVTQVLNKYKDSEFLLGDFDCCTWIYSVSAELYGCPAGIDKFTKVFGTYSNIEEATNVLKSWGCESLEDLPTMVWGVERKNISEVQHGDLVYLFNKKRNFGSLGYCNGKRAYFLGPKGLTPIPLSDCLYCWSIKEWKQ